MSQPIAIPEGRRLGARRVDPHRLAWGVLLLAFALFCIIAVIGIVGIDYFLFQSTVPIKSNLSRGRGTVGIMELANSIPRVGSNGDALTTGMIVSTDQQSQGTIRFTDPLAEDRLVASVTLHNSSALTLRQAARPRYEWSRTRHIIDLENVSGKLTITIPEAPGQNLLINVETPAGAIVNLEGDGEYTINAASDQVSVMNGKGSATLIPPDLRQGHSIPINGLGTVYYDTGAVEQKSGYINLLRDSDFDTLRSGPLDAQVWVCGSDPNDEPTGIYDFVPMDDVMSLRFVRGEDATTHGRTSCVQSFGQTGLDLASAEYNYLALRVNFYVEYQSLGACGFDGSECPLMIRMDYIDSSGEGQRWYHGFYAREADPQSNYRLRCASCLQDHDLINEKAWYTYESPNLLTLLEEPPPENVEGDEESEPLVPESIVSLWLYASGHQYDVRLGDVALIGARVDNAEGDVASTVETS